MGGELDVNIAPIIYLFGMGCILGIWQLGGWEGRFDHVHIAPIIYLFAMGCILGIWQLGGWEGRSDHVHIAPIIYFFGMGCINVGCYEVVM